MDPARKVLKINTFRVFHFKPECMQAYAAYLTASLNSCLLRFPALFMRI